MIDTKILNLKYTDKEKDIKEYVENNLDSMRENRKGQIYSHSTCPPEHWFHQNAKSYSPRREESLPH